MAYKRPLIPYLLVAGMTAALAVLAVLQYRWSEQVSRAERDRMRSSLAIAVQHFRQEFNRDFLSICTALQPEGQTLERADWDAYARQIAEGLRTASESRVVSAVYLWEPANRQGSVRQLDRAAEAWVNVVTPAPVEALLRQFDTDEADRRPGFSFRPVGWSLDSAVPALVRALRLPPGFSGGGSPQPSRLQGALVAVLDRDDLGRRFFPELAARHFSAGDGFVYQAEVFSKAPKGNRVVFQTSDFNVVSADLDVPLLEMRPRPGGDRQPEPPRHGPGEREYRDEHAGSDRGPGGPPGRFGGFGFGGRSRFGGRGGGFPFTLLLADSGPEWRLAVKHRAGSVDAAVETLRRRNLGVSFLILLLLGGSMALIVISAQRAQRLARLQMNFVAGVSHELRTPLSVISSAAQNLTDGIVDGKQQVKLYGTLIHNESRRLTGMMEQILQFASGQKKRAYEPVPLSPADLVESALALSASLIAENGTTVEKHVAPGLPLVAGESSALTQCVQNLIANAVKYGGEARWLGVRAWTEGGQVRIAVADRGIGIDRADLPHVFDPFYRGRAATAAQIHGTGLGLNLARTFAEQAGGSIAVETAPGEGTVFTLSLPAMRQPAAEPHPAVEPAV